MDRATEHRLMNLASLTLMQEREEHKCDIMRLVKKAYSEEEWEFFGELLLKEAKRQEGDD